MLQEIDDFFVFSLHLNEKRIQSPNFITKKVRKRHRLICDHRFRVLFNKRQAGGGRRGADLRAASRYPNNWQKKLTKHEMKSAYIKCHMLCRGIIWHEQRKENEKRWKNFALKWYTAEAQRHVNGAIFQYSRDSVMFLTRDDKRLFHLRLLGRGVVSSKALWVAVTALEFAELLCHFKNSFSRCHDAFNSSLMKMFKVSIATEKSWQHYVHLGHCWSIKCQYLSRILSFKVGQTFSDTLTTLSTRIGPIDLNESEQRKITMHQRCRSSARTWLHSRDLLVCKI